MQCSVCSAENPLDSRFCNGCGAGLGMTELATLPATPVDAEPTRLTSPSQPTTPGSQPTRPRQGSLDAALGMTISGYRVERKLGQGGMGAVYLAEQLKLKRKAAIKVLPPELSMHPPLIERFEREARALARLDHPHIVPIYDLFSHEGTFCIAMAYLDGGSVRDLLRREGFVDEARSAALVRDAAQGLWAAAQKGIVHRDVKPDNLLLSADGVVKVADFGLVKQGEATELTRTGTVLGTPAYMAPEQWEDSRMCDHRSDLYALGCTLFQLLCSRTPFVGPQTTNFMKQHVSDPIPRLRVKRPDVSSEMAQIVERLLQKRPEDRYQTGEELARALEPLAASKQEVGRSLPQPLGAAEASARQPSRPAWVMMVVFAGLLGVLCGAALLAWPAVRESWTQPDTATMRAALQEQGVARALLKRVAEQRADLQARVRQAEDWVRANESELAKQDPGTMGQAQVRGALERSYRRWEFLQELQLFATTHITSDSVLLLVEGRINEGEAFLVAERYPPALEAFQFVRAQLGDSDELLPLAEKCMEARDIAIDERRYCRRGVEDLGLLLSVEYLTAEQIWQEGMAAFGDQELVPAQASFEAAASAYSALAERINQFENGLQSWKSKERSVGRLWERYLAAQQLEPTLEPSMDNAGAPLYRARSRREEVTRAVEERLLDEAEFALAEAMRLLLEADAALQP